MEPASIQTASTAAPRAGSLEHPEVVERVPGHVIAVLVDEFDDFDTDIGFHGASIKVGEHTIPAYIPHVGGAYEGGEVRYGERLKARLPAKRVTEAVRRWVRFYEADRQDREPFGAFVDRVGPAEFESRVKDLTMPIEFSLENMSHFIDWTKTTPFQVIRSEGECSI